MKSKTLIWQALAGLLMAGCATHQQSLVLDTIGPGKDGPIDSSSQGTLVVFSAYEPTGADLLLRNRYAGYKIFSSEGRLLFKVQKNSEAEPGSPKRVHLNPGTYRIESPANGYGMVVVPVLIDRHQTTCVHLEGGSGWLGKGRRSNNDVIRLPGGEVAGWAARDRSKEDGRF